MEVSVSNAYLFAIFMFLLRIFIKVGLSRHKEFLYDFRVGKHSEGRINVTALKIKSYSIGTHGNVEKRSLE